MPKFPIGVEVAPVGVRCNNGGWCEVLVTETDADGTFEMRTTCDAGGMASVTVKIPAETDLTGDVPEGTTTWNVGTRKLTEDSTFNLQGR